MNVISLKTTASGVIYTCPSGTVAEVEIVAIGSGVGALEVVSNGVTMPWITGGASFLLRSSITQGSGQASAAADNVFAEELAGAYMLRPKFLKLTAGDTLNVSSAKNCTLIIYEETTGAH